MQRLASHSCHGVGYDINNTFTSKLEIIFNTFVCTSNCLVVQERAGAFINEVKRNPDIWRLCTERFTTTGYQEVSVPSPTSC